MSIQNHSNFHVYDIKQTEVQKMINAQIYDCKRFYQNVYIHQKGILF